MGAQRAQRRLFENSSAVEAHRILREEVAGDGIPEEPTGLRAILQAAKGVEAESAPKLHYGAEESQTAGNAETRRWVSDWGRERFLSFLPPSKYSATELWQTRTHRPVR